MAKLWQGSGGGLHPLVEAYTVGEDYRLDGEFLLPYDLKASEAHATMLQKIGVLTAEELTTLKRALQEIGDLWRKGDFKVTLSQEDGHTAIEQYITEKYGEVGKKIHTGRSRNDQSMTMIRLYSLEQLKTVKALVLELSKAAEARGSELKAVPMPGYTHMQRAMPTTVGTWLGSFAAGWLDAQKLLEGAMAVLDQNPLGSAAGFGINGLQLDRGETAKLMGFAGVQHNPMYCGLSRGMFENVALQAMSLPMVLSSRFATDMMMFTQQESLFVALPDNFVTGSSIMPQKKNYDLFEIMRANGKVFGSLQMQIQETIVGLGSGYHRDLQCTKKAFIEACELCTSTLRLLKEVLPALQVREEKLRAAMTEDLYVTDEVYKLVAKGKAFREAYGEAKEAFFKRKAQEDEATSKKAMRGPSWQEAVHALSHESEPSLAACTKAVAACRGQWQQALRCFGKATPDVALFGAAVAVCEWEVSWGLLAQLRRARLRRSSRVFGAALRGSRWLEALEGLRELAEVSLQKTFFCCNLATNACARGQQWPEAVALHEQTGSDLVSFGTAVSACERGSQWEAAAALAVSLREARLQGNIITYNTAISAFAKGQQWPGAQLLLAELQTRHLQGDSVTEETITGPWQQAAERIWSSALHWHRVLEQLRQAPCDAFTFSWSISRCGDRWPAALALLHEQGLRRLRRTVVALGAATSASAAGGWRLAPALLAAADFGPDLALCGAALKACAEHPRQTQRLLEDFKLDPDGAYSIAFASGHVTDWRWALIFLDQMEVMQVRQSTLVYNAAMNLCAKSSKWQLATALFEVLASKGMRRDAISGGCLLSALEAVQLWRCSLQVLVLDASPDAVALNSDAACACAATHWPHALHLAGMAGTAGKDSTAALQSLGWRRALRRLSEMRRWTQPDLISFNACLHSVEVAGAWAAALALLREVPGPDVLSFNAAMRCCVQAQQWSEALQVLQGTGGFNVLSLEAALRACALGEEATLAARLLATLKKGFVFRLSGREVRLDPLLEQNREEDADMTVEGKDSHEVEEMAAFEVEDSQDSHAIPWRRFGLKFFVTLIVFVTATLLLEIYAKESITSFSKWLMDAIGLPGLFVAVLIGDGLPQPFTYVPLIFLAVKASVPKALVFSVCACGSYVAALAGYGAGVSLAKVPCYQSGLQRLSDSQPWLPELMQRKGAVGVAMAALMPIPLALATWTAGSFRVSFPQFLIAAMFRMPKILVFVLLSGAR
ncbi:unnamed protein product [Effrenium voratum]|nr:unnamed protein product [Effrenium voratum]